MGIWADIVGILGFILSVVTLVISAWKGRRHLQVSIDFNSAFGTAFISSMYHNAVIAFLFENKSTNHISVTFVEICCNDGSVYRCGLHGGCIFHKFRRSIDPDANNYERFIESCDFPIDLCAFGAAYEYAIFAMPKERLWNDIAEVAVQTNRGRIHLTNPDTICKLQEFLQKPIQEKSEIPIDFQR